MLWDRTPAPVHLGQSIPIPGDALREDGWRRGAEALSWPTLSGLGPEVTPVGERTSLDASLSRLVHVVFSKLIDGISAMHPRAAALIKDLGVFNSPDAVSAGVVMVDSVRVTAQERSRTWSADLPYWYENGALYVSRSLQLERVLPEFVDTECGTTFTPFFGYIWRDEDVANEAIERRASMDTNKRSEDGHQSFGSSSAGTASHSARDVQRNEDWGSDDAQESVGSTDSSRRGSAGVSGPPGRQATRSRLYSYVAAPHGRADQSVNVERGERREEVERAGVAKLVAYLEGAGLAYRSVESEHVGYDFEIQTGSGLIYLEVKSSASEWAGWENNLTPNEFFVAKRLGDRYFLCVIDRVLSEESSLYFIQDPAGRADGFLFDEPWKHLSIDLKGFVQG